MQQTLSISWTRSVSSVKRASNHQHFGHSNRQDPETHKLLVASVTQSIKQEKLEDRNTNVYPKKHVTAAAGSAAQLDRV